MAKRYLKSVYPVDNAVLTNPLAISPGLSDFTYQIWACKRPSLEGSNLISAADPANQSISLRITAEGKAQFQIHNDPVAQIDITGDTIIDDDELHLITVTGDRDGLLRLYLDSVEDADPIDLLPLAETDFLLNDNALLVTGPSAAGPAVSCYADQALFLRAALTLEQISLFFNDDYGINIDEDEIAALSPLGAWYSEFDTSDRTFIGRHCNDLEWLNSDGTLEGGITVLDGGIPLQSVITASAGTGGSVSPSGEVEVVDGEAQEFTAAPAAGYQVNQWLVNGAVVHSGGLTHTLRDISDDMTIAVTFSAVARQLCTIADIKDRLGIGVSNIEYDALINRIILGVEEIFNSETGRTLLMTSDDVTEYYTGGCPYLQLERYPVISITSIKESALYTFGDESALTADTDYRLAKEGKNGIIYRLGYKWSDFEDAIQIIYRAGYCGADETPGVGEHALPANLREAAIMQVSFIFKRRNDIGLSSVSAEGGAINVFSSMDLLPLVEETLKKYRRPRL